ncbi:MspA family porin [Mycolicibacterium sp. 624]|uniref:MspA family porin n=1 Tax=Mycolicibacterium sp. 624 TaxID=3156314 RepID=UPI0033971736
MSVLAAVACPVASADPPPPAPAVSDEPPAPAGLMAPAEASFFQTPDGWQLTVSAKNETLLPVAPLTTAASSREYAVGGTFVGNVAGGGSTTLSGGTFEVGFRIGCGITADVVDLAGSIGISPTLKFPLTGDSNFPSVGGLVRVHLRPGVVNIVPVAKKSFKATEVRVNIADFRVKIDSCAGQSFIQSYATLSSSTTDTEDLTTYLGTVKVV